MRAFPLLLALGWVLGVTSQEVIVPSVLTEEPVTDTYHGITVEDPYRYVENLDDPKVASWMREHTNYARAQLDAIPGRKSVLNKMYEFDKRLESRVTTVRITDNGHYFYLKFRPEDNNGKLYHRKGYNGEEKLIFDPETYSPGTAHNYVVSNIVPDSKGEKVMVLVSADGSENADLIVLDRDGRRHADPISNCSTWGSSWMPGDQSFTYLRYNSADIKDVNRQLNMKVFLHEFGKPDDNDKVVLSSTASPQLEIKPEEIPILRYDRTTDYYYALPVTVENRIRAYIAPAKGKTIPLKWQQICNLEDEVTWFEMNREYIYLMSIKDAPHSKILRIPLNNPTMDNAETVVPNHEKEVIRDMVVTTKGIYYNTMENGVKARAYFIPEGSSSPQQLDLPIAAGSIYLSHIDAGSPDVYMTITGWTSPAKRYQYHPEHNTFEFRPLSTVAEYPELDKLDVKEISFKSHDGTEVPLSIIHKKGLELNGRQPTILYGYGSYGAAFTPGFSPVLLNFAVHDGVFAIAHVRGGGELGDSWHRAGQKTKKHNTWKDAIAAAEYLIDRQYASKETLGIWGGSAGGILVGRAMTDRPDLFAYAIPEVGAMNTVRMEETPNGPVNAPEFGTVKDEEEFKGLLEMDSYLHLEDGVEYPATLVTAGINDPRVVAWEPAKFAARLQKAQKGDNPVLFYTDFEAGHGIGDSKSKSFNSFADIFAFALWQGGHPDFQPREKLKAE